MPEAIQTIWKNKYEKFLKDPADPILQTEKKKGKSAGKFSIRLGREHRAVYTKHRDDDGNLTYCWLWIGAHGEYDRRLDSGSWPAP